MSFFVIAPAVLLVVGWYVFHWDVFFNSDFAMIGLIAKRVLETGEQFIFVPKVGYQGMLIEGNLGALLFKAFGINPFSLHAVAAVGFAALIISFYFAVKVWCSEKEARLASVLLCFSAPLFFGNVLRTQPNYPETFALGCFLFRLYKKMQERERLIDWILFGSVSGFGFYLYGQIIYFVAAIILCLVVQKRNYPGSLNKISWLWILALIIPSPVIRGLKIPGPSIAIVATGVWGLLFLRKNTEDLIGLFQKKKKPLLWMAGSFLIGYSPTLYNRVVLGNRTVSGFAFIKFSEEFYRNAELFLKNLPIFTVAREPLIISVVLTVVFISLVVWRLKNNNPLLFLGPIVLVATLLSRSVYNSFSIRYTLAWQLTVALVLAQVFFSIERKQRWLARGLLAVLLLFRVWTHMTALEQYDYYAEQLPRWKDMAPVVSYLQEEKVTKGFGDYWISYIATFVTNEDLVLEPLYSSYLPFYEEAVKKENKIALIKYGVETWYSPNFPKDQNSIEIRGNTYSIRSVRVFHPWYVWILDKEEVLTAKVSKKGKANS